MKNHTQIIRTLFIGSLLGVASLSAQSCAATNNLAAASSHAINASGEVVQSGAASVAASAQAGAAVLATPVWAVGAGLSGAGAVSSAIGNASSEAGGAMRKDAKSLWDFASGDPEQRPALDRTKPVTPPVKAAVAKPKDPSPSEAMKRL